MNETLALVLALVTGVLLGAMFFGGLWWTVRCERALPWRVSIISRAVIGSDCWCASLDSS